MSDQESHFTFKRHIYQLFYGNVSIYTLRKKCYNGVDPLLLGLWHFQLNSLMIITYGLCQG